MRSCFTVLSPTCVHRGGLPVLGMLQSCEAATVLIDAGADVNAQNDLSGATPLQMGASRGRLEICKLVTHARSLFFALFDCRNSTSNPNSKCLACVFRGTCPLCLCAGVTCNMQLPCALLTLRPAAPQLLARGADPTLRDDGGRCAADMADQGAGPELQKLLIEAPAPPPPAGAGPGQVLRATRAPLSVCRIHATLSCILSPDPHPHPAPGPGRLCEPGDRGVERADRRAAGHAGGDAPGGEHCLQGWRPVSPHLRSNYGSPNYALVPHCTRQTAICSARCVRGPPCTVSLNRGSGGAATGPGRSGPTATPSWSRRASPGRSRPAAPGPQTRPT